MQLFRKTTFILLQLFFIPWCLAEISQPYCYQNVTETTYKMVTKTRLKSVGSKNFFKKMILKKDTQVEMYEEQEPVYKIKVERICCEGYKLSEYNNVCEPQCVEKGCPQYSHCVEPEVCACEKGYISIRSTADAKHYCEPLCEQPCPEYSECVGPNQCACIKGYYNVEQKCKPFCVSGCPHGGVCIGPNKCNCPMGYTAKRASCLPNCSLGDHCQNGVCVANDVCICDTDFSWNTESFKCEGQQLGSSTFYPEDTESEQPVPDILQIETDIETSNDNIDPNQVFDEDIEMTTFYVTDEYDSTTRYSLISNRNCPPDHVFHKGQCRPLKFVSNEIDCWLKPCHDKNAVCLANGTCDCNEGYKWFRSPIVDHIADVNEDRKGICLTNEEYEARMQNLENEPQRDTIAKPTNITLIFFITLGVLIIVGALVFLSWKLFHRQTGKIDVEGKNLACAYNNRACTETEKSII